MIRPLRLPEKVASPARIELATPSLGNWRSIRLSYGDPHGAAPSLRSFLFSIQFHSNQSESMVFPFYPFLQNHFPLTTGNTRTSQPIFLFSNFAHVFRKLLLYPTELRSRRQELSST